MLLDTSVLVELLRRAPDDPFSRRIQSELAGRVLFASPIHLGELADVARRHGLPPRDLVEPALAMVELVPLDVDIAVTASHIKAEARSRPSGKDFSLVDGIGLASARSRSMTLLTLDAEFVGLEGATVLRRP